MKSNRERCRNVNAVVVCVVVAFAGLHCDSGSRAPDTGGMGGAGGLAGSTGAGGGGAAGGVGGSSDGGQAGGGGSGAEGSGGTAGGGAGGHGGSGGTAGAGGGSGGTAGVDGGGGAGGHGGGGAADAGGVGARGGAGAAGTGGGGMGGSAPRCTGGRDGQLQDPSCPGRPCQTNADCGNSLKCFHAASITDCATASPGRCLMWIGGNCATHSNTCDCFVDRSQVTCAAVAPSASCIPSPANSFLPPPDGCYACYASSP
jgi:hypothetical protein